MTAFAASTMINKNSIPAVCCVLPLLCNIFFLRGLTTIITFAIKTTLQTTTLINKSLLLAIMDYLDLVKLYASLEKTSKRLEKTVLVGEFLQSHKGGCHIIYLIEGKVFPDWDSRKMGVASRLLLKALSVSTGESIAKIEMRWKKLGDIGEVAEELTKKKTQSTLFSQSLTVDKVQKNLEKLAELEGQGTVDRKVKIIAELLSSASPLEAKYLVRTVIGDMRTGLGEGVMRDAIVWAYLSKEIQVSYDKEKNALVFGTDRKDYAQAVDEVEEAYNLTNDFAKIAELLEKKGRKGLSSIELTPGKPIKVMLYPKAETIEEALKTVGSPAACEYKFDGFRLQIHKNADKVWMFTRRLEEVSKQFPELIALVKKNIKVSSCIIDSEAVGFSVKTGKYLPFQNISQRIKRKYDIEELAKKLPVELNMFDLMYLDGKTLIKESFEKRRKKLLKVVVNKPLIRVIDQLVTDDAKKIDDFYKESLKSGNEGLMIKNIEGMYKPGKRVGYGVKLKPVMETLDVVIVGGEWGEGKRAHWISSFRIAVRNANGDLVEIGRVATGLKEKPEEGFSFAEMTELLKPLIVKETGKEVVVNPSVVIEVAYEEIQKSPTYSSGYALRFPRFLALRADRGVEDSSDLDLVEELYNKQRGRS
ncbi:ATP-dependent DNA ligase [Candidatus Woesearchaeota archaeon]|nr:ATP-dependent DNA ligase [Candidatus Woesearchaeota archaeon]